jgi:aspartate kinase
MLEMASSAQSFANSICSIAGKYKVPMRVLSSFTPWDIDIHEEAKSGTLITFEEDEKMEQAVVSGIAFNRDEAKNFCGGRAAQTRYCVLNFGRAAYANIEVDMIIQNLSKEGVTDFSFTVHRNDFARTMDLLKESRAIRN